MTKIIDIKVNSTIYSQLDRMVSSFSRMERSLQNVENSINSLNSRLSTTGTRISRVSSGLNSMSSGVRRMNQEFSNTQSATRIFTNNLHTAADFGDRLFNTFHKLRFVMFAVGSALGVGAIVKRFTEDVYEANKSMEMSFATFQASLKDLTGQQTQATMKYLQDRSNVAPFSFQQLAEETKGLALLSGGFNTKFKKLEQFAELLAVFDPVQGLKGAGIAIREAISGDYKSLYQRFELPRSLFNKYKAQGLEPIEVLEKVFKEVGLGVELLDRANATMERRIAIISNTFKLFALRIGQQAFGNISRFIYNIAEQVQILKDPTSKVSETIGKIATQLAGLSQSLLTKTGIKVFFNNLDYYFIKIYELITRLRPAIEANLNAFEKWGQAKGLTGIQRLLKEIYYFWTAIFQGIASGAKMAAAILSPFINALDYIMQTLKITSGSIKDGDYALIKIIARMAVFLGMLKMFGVFYTLRNTMQIGVFAFNMLTSSIMRSEVAAVSLIASLSRVGALISLGGLGILGANTIMGNGGGTGWGTSLFALSSLAGIGVGGLFGMNRPHPVFANQRDNRLSLLYHGVTDTEIKGTALSRFMPVWEREAMGARNTRAQNMQHGVSGEDLVLPAMIAADWGRSLPKAFYDYNLKGNVLKAKQERITKDLLKNKEFTNTFMNMDYFESTLKGKGIDTSKYLTRFGEIKGESYKDQIKTLEVLYKNEPQGKEIRKMMESHNKLEAERFLRSPETKNDAKSTLSKIHRYRIQNLEADFLNLGAGGVRLTPEQQRAIGLRNAFIDKGEEIKQSYIYTSEDIKEKGASVKQKIAELKKIEKDVKDLEAYSNRIDSIHKKIDKQNRFIPGRARSVVTNNLPASYMQGTVAQNRIMQHLENVQLYEHAQGSRQALKHGIKDEQILKINEDFLNKFKTGYYSGNGLKAFMDEKNNVVSKEIIDRNLKKDELRKALEEDLKQQTAFKKQTNIHASQYARSEMLSAEYTQKTLMRDLLYGILFIPIMSVFSKLGAYLKSGWMSIFGGIGGASSIGGMFKILGGNIGKIFINLGSSLAKLWGWVSAIGASISIMGSAVAVLVAALAGWAVGSYVMGGNDKFFDWLNSKMPWAQKPTVKENAIWNVDVQKKAKFGNTVDQLETALSDSSSKLFEFAQKLDEINKEMWQIYESTPVYTELKKIKDFMKQGGINSYEELMNPSSKKIRNMYAGTDSSDLGLIEYSKNKFLGATKNSIILQNLKGNILEKLNTQKSYLKALESAKVGADGQSATKENIYVYETILDYLNKDKYSMKGKNWDLSTMKSKFALAQQLRQALLEKIQKDDSIFKGKHLSDIGNDVESLITSAQEKSLKVFLGIKDKMTTFESIMSGTIIGDIVQEQLEKMQNAKDIYKELFSSTGQINKVKQKKIKDIYGKSATAQDKIVRFAIQNILKANSEGLSSEGLSAMYTSTLKKLRYDLKDNFFQYADIFTSEFAEVGYGKNIPSLKGMIKNKIAKEMTGKDSIFAGPIAFNDYIMGNEFRKDLAKQKKIDMMDRVLDNIQNAKTDSEKESWNRVYQDLKGKTVGQFEKLLNTEDYSQGVGRKMRSLGPDSSAVERMQQLFVEKLNMQKAFQVTEMTLKQIRDILLNKESFEGKTPKEMDDMIYGKNKGIYSIHKNTSVEQLEKIKKDIDTQINKLQGNNPTKLNSNSNLDSELLGNKESIKLSMNQKKKETESYIDIMNDSFSIFNSTIQDFTVTLKDKTVELKDITNKAALNTNDKKFNSTGYTNSKQIVIKGMDLA